MAKAWPRVTADTAITRRMATASDPARTSGLIDWRQRMSNTLAYALLVYTALQIFVTMGVLTRQGGSLLPYLALVILVAAIIPSCRQFERRWNRLDAVQAADPTLACRFHRDRRIIWAMAIGLPFAITGAFRLLAVFFPAMAH